MCTVPCIVFFKLSFQNSCSEYKDTRNDLCPFLTYCFFLSNSISLKSVKGRNSSTQINIQENPLIKSNLKCHASYLTSEFASKSYFILKLINPKTKNGYLSHFYSKHGSNGKKMSSLSIPPKALECSDSSE
jgi:hypothetical protein